MSDPSEWNVQSCTYRSSDGSRVTNDAHQTFVGDIMNCAKTLWYLSDDLTEITNVVKDAVDKGKLEKEKKLQDRETQKKEYLEKKKDHRILKWYGIS